MRLLYLQQALDLGQRSKAESLAESLSAASAPEDPGDWGYLGAVLGLYRAGSRGGPTPAVSLLCDTAVGPGEVVCLCSRGLDVLQKTGRGDRQAAPGTSPGLSPVAGGRSIPPGEAGAQVLPTGGGHGGSVRRLLCAHAGTCGVLCGLCCGTAVLTGVSGLGGQDAPDEFTF